MSTRSPIILLFAPVALLLGPSLNPEADAPAQANPDPWPMWQRTASRLGRTTDADAGLETAHRSLGR